MNNHTRNIKLYLIKQNNLLLYFNIKFRILAAIARSNQAKCV